MIKKIIATLLATMFLAGAVATLTGCNTVEGAGKDIQQGGKAIKDEANEHKD
jgi:entericidin B